MVTNLKLSVRKFEAYGKETEVLHNTFGCVPGRHHWNFVVFAFHNPDDSTLDLEKEVIDGGILGMDSSSGGGDRYFVSGMRRCHCL